MDERKLQELWRCALAGLGFGIAMILIALMLSTALAHEWYPPQCCDGRDCHPTSCEGLVPFTEGGRSGFVYIDEWYFEASQMRRSEDDGCHICIHLKSPTWVYDHWRRGACFFQPSVGF